MFNVYSYVLSALSDIVQTQIPFLLNTNLKLKQIIHAEEKFSFPPLQLLLLGAKKHFKQQ